jgi:hypothetical protein
MARKKLRPAPIPKDQITVVGSNMVVERNRRDRPIPTGPVPKDKEPVLKIPKPPVKKVPVAKIPMVKVPKSNIRRK